MSKTLLIIISFAVLLFMGMMGAGFFILWNKISQMPQNPAMVEGIPEEEEAVIGPLYALDTMIVNLADHGGKRYLRVTMSLELSEPEVMTTIESRLPQVRDTILTILPTKTYEDVGTTEGKIALRTEVMEKINELITLGSVKNIYFTEFVVQ